MSWKIKQISREILSFVYEVNVMQKSEIKQELNLINSLYEDILSMVNFKELEDEVKEIEKTTYVQTFWDDVEKANKIVKKLKILKNKYNKIVEFKELYEECVMTSEFLLLGEDVLSEFKESVDSLVNKAETLGVELLLKEENDKLNAIIEIHPGAGGTESMDWAEMLFRMYKRYGETNHLEYELFDYLNGDEAGLKSVTFGLRGDNVYGYLKSEIGVHRLVRISPFDSAGRRHTSFASVNVIPEVDDSIEIEINENDLKIDTFRSSGAGGQSVNTTDSAVRITHLPTNLVVNVQNERSQIKNRAQAMQILKGKLYQLEEEKKQAELSSHRQTGVSNSFGSQIRSYVMHPYSMVKDHRTNIETGNVSKVMDGYIDPFINGFLKQKAKGEFND
jgi:peptide chain release factor 2